VTPHRGGTILAFGIIALVLSLCWLLGFIFGGIATSMANTDLSQMNYGRMDVSGRSQTETGKLLGTIAMVISGIMLALNCIALMGGLGRGIR
jgi:hypothetical protein